jgi:acetylornithine deacetylase/succinyl-diaminopimelate desuccinylase-like protein
MSIDNNLYEKSIKILTDLIAFKTVSGQDNSSLIDYCENILNDIGIDTFKVYDDDKKRVNLFGTLKAKIKAQKNQSYYLDIQMWSQCLKVGAVTHLLQQLKMINFMEEGRVI